nr:ChaB family protein [Nocardiopsis algeriensis]
MPSTLRRSPEKAQRTWIEAHDSAVEQYGEGERAHRVAFAAVKHRFQKKGDRWVPKPRSGTSDDNDAGVDAASSKSHLYRLAQDLDIRGRSTMSKQELVEALRKASRRQAKPH